MQAEAQQEHKWLEQLVGEWSFEGECPMGPDGETSKHTGVDRVRTLGGIWAICEGEGEMPGGGISQSIMTLGYDPQKKRFVGTFVCSPMTHLWIYEGSLDASGKILTLDCEGPEFSPDGTITGKMAKYQDIIEFVSPDHRTLSSQVLGPDGTWTRFMTAHYRRKK